MQVDSGGILLVGAMASEGSIIDISLGSSCTPSSWLSPSGTNLCTLLVMSEHIFYDKTGSTSTVCTPATQPARISNTPGSSE